MRARHEDPHRAHKLDDVHRTLSRAQLEDHHRARSIDHLHRTPSRFHHEDHHRARSLDHPRSTPSRFHHEDRHRARSLDHPRSTRLTSDLSILFVCSLFALAACEPDELSRAGELEEPADAGRARPPRPIDPPISDAGVVEADAELAADANEPDAGIEPAREPLYVCSEHELYSYDPTNGRMNLVGSFAPFTGESMIDIAIDRQGRLFGGTFSGGIYAIDPNTAEVRLLSRLANIPTGLTFLSDGRLVIAGARVSIIDPQTGAIDAVITASAPQTSGDIIGLPDGSLYASVIAGASGDDLVRIDPQSGAVTNIGSLGVAGVFGLGYANGVMYGFTHVGESLAIDPNTARVSDRQAFNEPFFGATTNPVVW